MKDDVISLIKLHATNEMDSLLEQALRKGACLLLQQAIENEATEYLERRVGYAHPYSTTSLFLSYTSKRSEQTPYRKVCDIRYIRP